MSTVNTTNVKNAASPVNNIELSTTGDTTIQSLNTGQLAGLRNSIINGGMQVWQRATNITPLGGGGQVLGVEITDTQLYGCDRWESRSTTNSGGQCQQMQLNGSMGKSLALETSGLTSYQFIQQYIEVQNCIYLSNQKCTVSWYSDKSTSRVRLSSYDNSGTRVTEVDYTVTPTSLGNDRYAVTFDMGQINSSAGDETEKGVQIILYPDGQNTFNGRCVFWNVQLEIGSVATPYEVIPIQTQLANCQRYFQTLPNGLVQLFSETPDLTRSSCAIRAVEMRVDPNMNADFTNCTLKNDLSDKQKIHFETKDNINTAYSKNVTSDAEL